MQDPRDEMLRDMAAHRGLRLVRSRRRKPGGDFGRYGLTDIKTGQDCFGIGKDGLEATADEIEDYLRRGAVADWKRSLGIAGKAAADAKPKPKKREEPEPEGPRRKRKPEPEPEPEPEPGPEPEPKPEPEPEPVPEPELVIREAKANEADAIAALTGTDAAELRASLRQLVQSGEAPFVAERGGLVGCAAWHVVPTLQHGAVGRLTLLVVAPEERRRGVGAALLTAVEGRFAERGCERAEAVSDIDLSNAHGFFRKAGYERTSYRFGKAL